MDLEEFVSVTLKQIVGGVSRAQRELRVDGKLVNPHGRGSSSGLEFEGTPIQTVSFDVAVTASEKSELGGGISVIGLNLKLGGSTADLSSSVSRVRFSVPVGFPPGRAQ